MTEIMQNSPKNGMSGPAFSLVRINSTILTHHIAVYIPSVNANGKISDKHRKRAITLCRKTMIQICGGATEWNAWGSWQSGNDLICEPVRIISAFIPENDDKVFGRLIGLCRQLKEMLRQERIAIEIDFRLHLI